ncbi:MAG: DUF3006 family protein [Fimbriimonadales bacterium]
MRRLFVDRIETTEQGERIAVLLVPLSEGDYLEWLCPAEWLPPDTHEGSWLQVAFTLDEATRTEMRQEIEELLRELHEE